ncbi:response regulator [Planctomyces sp. SH-PL62]|uniref:response regulator n=1 Tax=Planctomyces sp. SH-PL62 TaxID=1636152 RepID=UPI00078C3F1A|nr:response regulator [Planctomyces sp. SH-PL62]AMV36572.1 Response regulator ArlR [Planctomyces sp. SH-PL62]
MRPTRVLIVDDNRDAADLAVMVLNFEGHQAEAAYNGLDALQADRRFRPDVVLLDIGMPDMDGCQLAEALRRESPPPLLIALSGLADEVARERSRDAGCARHLVKPVDIEVLLALVAAAPAREP